MTGRIYKDVYTIRVLDKQNTTRGHYQADVLQKTTNKWFRTSDDQAPVEIGRKDLTERGYVFMYKKTD